MNAPKIYEIISWSLLGVGIIFVLWYVFGKSPTVEQSLIAMLIPYIIKLHYVSGAHSSDIKHIKEDIIIMKDGLQKISEDLQSIKSK